MPESAPRLAIDVNLVSSCFTIIRHKHMMMTTIDLGREAQLVESIHQPWKATLGECLQRWRALDATTRSQSYLVVQGTRDGYRQTLNASRIAELASTAQQAA